MIPVASDRRTPQHPRRYREFPEGRLEEQAVAQSLELGGQWYVRTKVGFMLFPGEVVAV